MDRRDLLKTMLSALPGVPTISSIYKVDPDPGQIFVIETDDRVCHEEAEMIRRAWDTVFEKCDLKAPPCLVLSGCSLKVAKLP